MCSLVCSWDPSLLIFVIVMSVLAKQIHKKFANKEHANRKTVVRLMISMMVVMALFGLTWVFGALTVREASTAFQFLCAIFNSLQGFFISLFFCVFGKEGREFWLQVLCCGGRIKSVTALTQLNVKLAKHTSPGRLSETNHIITGQTPGGPLPSNSNPAVQSANILVSNQVCSLIVKLLRTLRLSSWRQWMRVTPVSHIQFIEVYPSAREASTSMHSLAEQSQILTDVPDHDQRAPVASGEVQIDSSP